jgi:predicted dehydrogenase
MDMTRKKGTVVVVGDVGLGLERQPFYKKEIDLKISCAYGPGRYDPDYEEKGIDYPYAYVRWTENRNMKAFQQLLHSGKINIDYLTTHTFKLDDAPKAYDMIMEKSESYLGILIEYDISKKIDSKKVILQYPSHLTPHPSPVRLAFIGAGSYAMSYLLPNIPKDKDVVLKGVMTSKGTSSRTVAEKFGFDFCTSDQNDIFKSNEINTVFIVTRHDSHGKYTSEALKHGKHVYVEKPLCLTEAELEHIVETVNAGIGDPKNSNLADLSARHFPRLMVGFNRRFAPLSKILKEKFGNGPMSMIYRINAGHIPSDSWIQDKDIGGGRIIGEVCHFVDFLTFINGSLPENVYATALPDSHSNEDSVNVNLSFGNGSIGTISYFSTGPKSLSKEYIEIFKTGTTAVLKDFKELEIYSEKKIFRKKLMSQDKGQKKMVETFIDSIKTGKPSPISFDEIYGVTLTTFKIIESIRLKQSVQIK